MFNMFKKYGLWLGALLLLAGCAAAPVLTPQAQPTPTLLRWQVNELDARGDELAPTLVVAAPDGGDWRWLWTDALGMPLARETLHDGAWQADGKLPPNKAARPLFTTLMALSLDEAARERVFPGLAVGTSPNGGDVEKITAITVVHSKVLPNIVTHFIVSCPAWVIKVKVQGMHRVWPTSDELLQCGGQDSFPVLIFPMKLHYQIRKLP